MSEYSVYFNPPGFDDYPRTVQDTVDHVALNAHVERTDVDDVYVGGSTIPSVEDNNKIWIHTPQPGDAPEPPLPVPPPPSGTSATRILVVSESYSPATMLRAYNPTTGAVDNTFSVSWITIPTPAIRGLALGPSGKYYIGVVNTGSGVATIYRINSDGSQDGTFTPGVFGGTYPFVRGLQVQPDGKIIAFGDFATYNATAAVCIVRINTDGTLDSTFVSTTGVSNASGAQTWIRTVGIQANGSILIGGYFDRYKGANLSSTRIGFCRLTSTASLDTSFTPYSNDGFNVTPYILVQGDQKILVGGQLGSIRRFLSTGAQDTSFSVRQASNSVENIVQTPDGKIYVAGQFSSPGIKVARLNSDGSTDSTFVSLLPNVGSHAYSLAVSSSGACFVSGVMFPAEASRLTSSGAIDNAFNVSISNHSVRQGLLLQESPEITSSNYSSGFINAAFSYQIVALPTPVISYSATGLPTGLSLNSSTGLISGTPTVSGIFPVLLGATNSSGTSTKGMNIQIFDAVPTTDFATPALRRYFSGTWFEFSTLNRGDIIITSDDEDVTFPWGESGKVYDLSPWGEANFTVPTLPTPPTGFKYKYYIGAQISQPSPPVITL